MLVAESPGVEEVRQREPLVGPTGRELNRALLRAGLLRERLRIINAVACKPLEPKTPADMHKAVVACQPLFWDQLKGVPPETPTLVCGRWARLAVTGKSKGVGTVRGFIDEEFRLERPCTKEFVSPESSSFEE